LNRYIVRGNSKFKPHTLRIYFYIVALILLLTAFSDCSQPADKIPKFSSNQDTLLIATKLHKGAGKFERIFAPLRFNEFSDLAYPIKLPDHLTNIKHAFKIIDYDAYWYLKHKDEENLTLPPFILEAILNKELDTTLLPTVDENQIDIISGMCDSVQVFVLDENNNQDLTDDSIRIIQPINWNSNENLIKISIDIYNGKKIVKDSTWVKVGSSLSKTFLLLGVAEYVTADFYLDDRFYQLGTADFQSSFSYLEPRFILLQEDSLVIDSIYLKDNLYPDEFVRLNNNYYRIHQVSKYGEYITLIKEQDFSAQTGTQIGIKAPEFMAISTAGDTIISSNMHDKPMLIANSCECGGDKKSLTAYYEIEKHYGSLAHIIHIDSGMPELNHDNGIHIEMEDAPNKNLYNQFRKAYCSRICYVIDKNNTVIDKFYIADWKDVLPKIFSSERKTI